MLLGNSVNLRNLSPAESQKHDSKRKAEAENQLTILAARLRSLDVERLHQKAERQVDDQDIEDAAAMNEDSELARLNAELTQFEDELLRQEEEKEVRYPDGKTAVQAMKEMINTRAAAWIKEDGEGHNGAVLNEEDESKRFWAELARREQEIEARYQERKRAEEMKVTAGVKKGKRLDESKMSTLEEDEKKEDQDKMEEEKDEEEWHNDESEKVESFEAEMEWFEARRPRAPKMR